MKVTTPKDKEFTTEEILNVLIQENTKAVENNLDTYSVRFYQDIDMDLCLDIINMYKKTGWSTIYKPKANKTIFNFKKI